MTSKERFVLALENKVPDRLPVTTHHVMEYFLKKIFRRNKSSGFLQQIWIRPDCLGEQ